MTTFNLGDLFDIVAEAVPDRVAVIHGDVRLTYRELRERSDRVAAALTRRGVRRGQPVGLLMHSGTPYLEALLASYKLGVPAFNINYRYERDELHYLLRDAGAFALIHGAKFTPAVEDVLERLPHLELRLVTDNSGPNTGPNTAPNAYEEALAEPVGDTDISSGRSDQDITLLYTGGTTGMPKGVEWSHRALFFGALGGGGTFSPDGPVSAPQQLGERAAAMPQRSMLGLSPLMHAGGLWGALTQLLLGQTVVLLHSGSLDAELAWDLVERERIATLAFIGDAMAVPLIEAWDANPGRWDVSHLKALTWGGAPTSRHTQEELARCFPHAALVSSMGSSESGATGRGDVTSDSGGIMAMPPRPDLAVIIDGQRMATTGELGVFARSGHLPNGYWRDPKRTAETFVTVEGRRWVLTGDQATVADDGTIRLYGRESTCINSGGEKVFAEEVDSVVHSHPAVFDVVIIGAPDQRWGEVVTAIVTVRPGHTLTLPELQEHCRGKLAGYKLPRRLVLQAEIKRSPAGKADLTWARQVVHAG